MLKKTKIWVYSCLIMTKVKMRVLEIKTTRRQHEGCESKCAEGTGAQQNKETYWHILL